MIDPFTERHPGSGSFNYANNNPIRYIDPDGRDWVESKNGDINWRDDVTADNYQNEGVLKKGETYRGIFYERASSWNNKKYKGAVLETYHTYKKMTYSPIKDVQLEIGGEMRNSTIGDVNVTLFLILADGTERDWTYKAVAGGFGNGAPENGEYTTDTYRDRSENGDYNKGINRDGVGFSFNLNPLFDTGRTLLRIHPDGNNEGTLGCIGMSREKMILTNFRDNIKNIIQSKRSILTKIMINNNPNNDGRNGKKIPSVNE